MRPNNDPSSSSTLARLSLLGSLYFAQGLPFGFFSLALPVLLRRQGRSLGEVGLSSLLALPWALKLVWAPLVDRWWLPSLGRRRSWILPLQLAAVVVLGVLAWFAGRASLGALMAVVATLNLIAATQDIATDGLAVDLLAPRERGLANGVQVAGYRVGMVVGGGVLLAVSERLGQGGTFAAMAALMALSTVPVALSREPAAPAREPSSAAAEPHFLRRPGAARVLALLVVYKVGDALATSMLKPFLADQGLGLADIGWLLGTVGVMAGVVGALLGGALVNRLGQRRSLVVFGLLQAATVGGYALLAAGKPTLGALYVLCAAEHVAGGMATAALFTAMMGFCSRASSATDYTVQASAVAMATGLASVLAGLSAQALGYLGHFCLSTVVALASALAVRVCLPGPHADRPPRGAGALPAPGA